MNRNTKIALVALLACIPFASVANAGSKNHGHGKKSKHGGVVVGFNVGFGKDWGAKHAPAPYCAPPQQIWVPGHYETVCEKVWISGSEQRVWIAPVFELRYDSCGRAFHFCVSGGHWETVCEPGHYETRNVQVWLPGHWQGGHPGYGGPGY